MRSHNFGNRVRLVATSEIEESLVEIEDEKFLFRGERVYQRDRFLQKQMKKIWAQNKEVKKYLFYDQLKALFSVVDVVEELFGRLEVEVKIVENMCRKLLRLLRGPLRLDFEFRQN